MPGEGIDEIGVEPSLGVLALIQQLTFDTWSALGEFVDNSITSYWEYIKSHPEDTRFDELRVDIAIDEVTKRIEIRDNAAGIPNNAKGWHRALELGNSNPDPNHLGVHGFGMKAAALWWAPRFTVHSKVAGEHVSRYADMNTTLIQDLGLKKVPLKEISEADADDHFTRVTLYGLNQARSYPTGTTIRKILLYLGSMYRTFLRGEDGYVHPRTQQPFLRMTFRGEEIQAPEFEFLEEPFWPSPQGGTGRKVTWKKNFRIEIPNNDPSRVNVKKFVVKGWVGVLKTMSHKNAGLFLKFRGRGIGGVGQGANGNSDTFKPSEVFDKGNSWKKQRLVAEIDVTDYGKGAMTNEPRMSDTEKGDFLVALKNKFREMNFSQMAENFRVNRGTGFGENEKKKLERMIDETVDVANKSFAHLATITDLIEATPPKDRPTVAANQNRFTAKSDIETPLRNSAEFIAEFSGPGVPWLSVLNAQKGSGRSQIRVNNNHPFMRRYFVIPQNDPSGVYQIAIAMGAAEIDRPGDFSLRQLINRHLDATASLEESSGVGDE